MRYFFHLGSRLKGLSSTSGAEFTKNKSSSQSVLKKSFRRISEEILMFTLFSEINNYIY